jgi:hypothetical protein
MRAAPLSITLKTNLTYEKKPLLHNINYHAKSSTEILLITQLKNK